jgi:hypothetical protein
LDPSINIVHEEANSGGLAYGRLLACRIEFENRPRLFARVVERSSAVGMLLEVKAKLSVKRRRTVNVVASQHY